MASITIKNDREISSIRRAGQIVGSVLYDLIALVKPGVIPHDLDHTARQLILGRGGELAFLGYRGYPAAMCVSVNDVVVHGIPTKVPIAAGDLVGLDVGARVDGYYADAAVTIGVPPLAAKHSLLLDTTSQALKAAIDRLAPGRPLGDIQAAIEAVIETAGLGIVRDLTGHGIGQALHEPPEIPNYGRPGTGPILQKGMTLCIEPMVTLDDPAVTLDPDGWTIRTRDGSFGAQFEHTILVTENGAEILTPIRAWPKIARS